MHSELPLRQFIYAKMLPQLMKLINQAQLEKGTIEQIVSYLERELELNGLEAPDELQIIAVTQQATQQNQKHPNQLATTAKCKVNIETSAVNSNQKETKPKATRMVPAINNNSNNGGQTNSNSNKKNS